MHKFYFSHFIKQTAYCEQPNLRKPLAGERMENLEPNYLLCDMRVLRHIHNPSADKLPSAILDPARALVVLDEYHQK